MYMVMPLYPVGEGYNVEEEDAPFLTARGSKQQLQYTFRVSRFTAVETTSSQCLFKQGMPNTRHWRGKERQKYVVFLGQAHFHNTAPVVYAILPGT